MQQKVTTSTSANALYDHDYLLWIDRTVADLQAGNLHDLDLEHLIEEIEAMGRSEKRSLYSNLKIVLIHLPTFPPQNPFSPEKIFDSEYLPE